MMESKKDSKEEARRKRAGLYMTAEQFECLMRLATVRKGTKLREAVRLVLLEGYTIYAAEKKQKTGAGAVSTVMRRIRQRMEDVRVLQAPAVWLPPRRGEEAAEKHPA